MRILGVQSWDPARRVPTVSVLHRRLSSRDVCDGLARRGRVVSRHGSFLAPRLLHALGVSGRDDGGAGVVGDDDGVLRFSLVHYNTVADVHRLIAALEDMGF